MAIGIPDQPDSAGLVLSSHVYESCALYEQDYGHIGYIRPGAYPGVEPFPLSQAARHQVIEAFPATRIRRTALRTSVSNRAINQAVMALYRRI